MTNLKFDKELLNQLNDDYNRKYSQDDSGLFLGGSEVNNVNDINDPINEVNTDPRFRIRIQNIK